MTLEEDLGTENEHVSGILSIAVATFRPVLSWLYFGDSECLETLAYLGTN